MKLSWFVLLSLTLLCTFHPAYPQSVPAFPERLKGNWFLEENTNEWVFGVYDKLVYYKNDFWPYRVLSDTRLLLQKNGVVHHVVVTAQNDSVIQVSSRGAVQTLTNARRRMAAPEQAHYHAKSNTAYIKGYTAGGQPTVQFTVHDLLLGKPLVQTAEIDKNGWFNTRLPLPMHTVEVLVQFGNDVETILLSAGDTATLFFDGTLVIGGKAGALNNEYHHYLSYYRHNPDERNQMIRSSNEQEYITYELNKKKQADSLLLHYKQTYGMSAGLFERLLQANRFELPNALLRYRRLHLPDKRMAVSPEYTQLVNTFLVIDSNAWQAGSAFDAFVHEMMNATVADHLSNREPLDSFVIARSSPGRAFDYIQQHDKAMTPAQVKDIDRLLKYSPRFAYPNGKLSLSYSAADTSQFSDLLNWMLNNDYFVRYISNLELMHKLAVIDSLYPRGSFRDHLLGHYLYTHCLDNSRLILDESNLDTIRSMCAESTLYNGVVAANRHNQLLFETARYENLLTSSREETVLNRIARQHKGKAVYVDVWATWAVPCMEQFPYSKALKRELDGKPVSFVYLCCDSDVTDWQNMIKKYALPGQHLLLTPDEKKRLQAKYKFGSYPRYMVIDKQGRLLSSNSFAPQQKDLVLPMMEALAR